MRLELDNLPSDVGLLHQLVRDMASLVETRNDEIERLQAIIKKLQRMQFGRRSERLDPDQLALGLEDLDADIARIEEHRPVIAGDADAVGRRAHRALLPDHLEREEVVIDAQQTSRSVIDSHVSPPPSSVVPPVRAVRLTLCRKWRLGTETAVGETVVWTRTPSPHLGRGLDALPPAHSRCR